MPPQQHDDESSSSSVLIGPALHPPDLDKKLYRQILLPNGLRCLLIEDTLATPATLEDDDDDDESSSAGSSSHAAERKEQDHDHGPGHDSDDEDDGAFEDDEPGLRDAAVCVVVGVGSMYDPPDCQGMAHFLEHLLFMYVGCRCL